MAAASVTTPVGLAGLAMTTMEGERSTASIRSSWGANPSNSEPGSRRTSMPDLWQATA